MLNIALNAWAALTAVLLMIVVVRVYAKSFSRLNGQQKTVHAEEPLLVGSVPIVVESELDREMGILSFSARVLQLARDVNTPTGERLHYARIVSANLDEFFTVHILRRTGEASDLTQAQDHTDEGLQRLHTFANQLSNELHETLTEILGQLARCGFQIHRFVDLPAESQRELRAKFSNKIRPQLRVRPLWPNPDAYWRTSPALQLTAAIAYVDANGTRRVAGVPVTDLVGGYMRYADTANYVSFKEVLADSADTMVDGLIEYVSFFRVTHVAPPTKMNSPDPSGTERDHSHVTRIEVENAMLERDRAHVQRALLPLHNRQAPVAMIAVRELQDADAICSIASTLPDHCVFPPHAARVTPANSESLWETIRGNDVFLHHPYDDFTHSVVRFFEDAADDPAVQNISVVLYRIGPESRIADALMRAAENGKSVFVAIELRARGDELRNAEWASRFEAAGIRVLRGVSGLRNHAKITLVERLESGDLQSYAHIGTGNYNTSTAGAYSDFGLLTAHPEVCNDLRLAFTALENGIGVNSLSLRSCLIAPNQMRKQLRQRIARETEHARAGRYARIRMKMNGLVDRTCIELLYEASQAGVQIDLIVRGVCTLRPGVKGLSENIRVTSIIGRFLEHARVFAFENGGDPEYFIGSADLRPRNLKRRVEVLVPLLSPHVCARMEEILTSELNEPNAWTLNSDGSYSSETISAEPTYI